MKQKFVEKQKQIFKNDWKKQRYKKKLSIYKKKQTKRDVEGTKQNSKKEKEEIKNADYK